MGKLIDPIQIARRVTLQNKDKWGVKRGETPIIAVSGDWKSGKTQFVTELGYALSTIYYHIAKTCEGYGSIIPFKGIEIDLDPKPSLETLNRELISDADKRRCKGPSGYSLPYIDTLVKSTESYKHFIVGSNILPNLEFIFADSNQKNIRDLKTNEFREAANNRIISPIKSSGDYAFIIEDLDGDSPELHSKADYKFIMLDMSAGNSRINKALGSAVSTMYYSIEDELNNFFDRWKERYVENPASILQLESYKKTVTNIIKNDTEENLEKLINKINKEVNDKMIVDGIENSIINVCKSTEFGLLFNFVKVENYQTEYKKHGNLIMAQLLDNLSLNKHNFYEGKENNDSENSEADNSSKSKSEHRESIYVSKLACLYDERNRFAEESRRLNNKEKIELSNIGKPLLYLAENEKGFEWLRELSFLKEIVNVANYIVFKDEYKNLVKPMNYRGADDYLKRIGA